MRVEFEIWIDDIEHTLDSTLYDFGAVVHHSEDGMEVLEGPEFVDTSITDEYGNKWEPHGEQMEAMEDILYEWWYLEKEENRL
jgi:hypothetical protein